MAKRIKIGIIGAGVSGLVLANELSSDYDVTVFEKSRGTGGRLATRYNQKHHSFDMGAQFFIAKSPEFKDFLQPYLDKGLLQAWSGKFIEIEGSSVKHENQWSDDFYHYVGTPKMTSWCKALASSLKVQQQQKITAIIPIQEGYFLESHGDQRLGPFDLILLAIPVTQAIELLPDMISFKSQLNRYHMLSCYSMMLGFDRSLPIDFSAAIVKQRDISWISNNLSRPNRSNQNPSLTVLSTNHYADHHQQLDKTEILTHLKQQVAQTLSTELPPTSHEDLHLWRYANIPKQQGDLCYFEPTQRIGVCGDWCQQGVVEAAYHSATRLAAKVQQSIRK